jgi:hypothetical protein
VNKFRLSKAEDYEAKYELLFKDNQKTVSDFIETKQELEKTRKDLDKLQLDYQQANLTIKNLRGEVEA